jgi:hypothetical protein
MPPTAIVAFFSPCDYKLPRKHLAATLKWLLDEGLHVICAQVARLLEGSRICHARLSVPNRRRWRVRG